MKKVILAAAATSGLLALAVPGAPALAAGPAEPVHLDGIAAHQNRPSIAVTNADSAELRRAVTVEGIVAHERVLQSIANRNQGNRASGTRGYTESAAYVKKRLRKAGYKVRTQKFTIPFYREIEPATLSVTSPFATDLPTDTFTFSGSGKVDGPVQLAGGTLFPPGPTEPSDAGCDRSDFPRRAPAHAIVLVQRGTCSYDEKVTHAEAAGYAAVVIFDNGTDDEDGPLTGVLDHAAKVPVVGLDTEHGEALAEALLDGSITMEVSSKTESDPKRSTTNIIADSPRGKTGKTVVVGAHLDSVLTGPGINDNGSGTAATLEIAEQMAKLGDTRKAKLQRQLRFTFFGAEENGLLGSKHYVDSLTNAQRAKIYAYLNFDMLGSPNYARFRYDAQGQPPGSAAVERIFSDYFDAEGLATAPVQVGARADHASFAAEGIPVGGLFSGAEAKKTTAEAATFGGTAGAPYDPCYHQTCDTISGQNLDALGQLSDGAAHAVYVLTQTTTGLFPDSRPAPARTSRPLGVSNAPQARA